MKLNLEDPICAAIDGFQAAATGGGTWHRALEKLAEATGSRSAQLIGFGRDYTVPFNIATNLSDAALRDFVSSRGNDPKVNPRLQQALLTEIPNVATESDFLSPEEHAEHPHFKGYAARWDIPFSCFTIVERRDGMLIGLAVLRSKAQGHIGTREREMFASIAPHVRTAVRTRLALEGQGAKIAARLLDAVSLAVFVCDRHGVVRAMTTAAESLVTHGAVLQINNSRLNLTAPAEGIKLQEAIVTISNPASAVSSGSGRPRRKSIVVLPAEDRTNPLVLDVVPFVNPYNGFNFDPCVLVIASTNRSSDQRRAIVLQSAYELTAAEVEVALQLLSGHNPDAIASQRSVAIGTVRAQIKSILAKVGVSRQIELLVRLAEI
jgi:DNA-binding CsgD family transcriptional regulator